MSTRLMIGCVQMLLQPGTWTTVSISWRRLPLGPAWRRSREERSIVRPLLGLGQQISALSAAAEFFQAGPGERFDAAIEQLGIHFLPNKILPKLFTFRPDRVQDKRGEGGKLAAEEL